MIYLVALAVFSALLLHPYGRRLLLTMLCVCVVGFGAMLVLVVSLPHAPPS